MTDDELLARLESMRRSSLLLNFPADAETVAQAAARLRELIAERNDYSALMLKPLVDRLAEVLRERDKLRELLTRARRPPKHHDCLPFSGNCEACILNYDIDAALAPEQASGPAQGIAKHAEFPMLCIGKAIDCVLPNGHDGDCQVP